MASTDSLPVPPELTDYAVQLIVNSMTMMDATEAAHWVQDNKHQSRRIVDDAIDAQTKEENFMMGFLIGCNFISILQTFKKITSETQTEGTAN